MSSDLIVKCLTYFAIGFFGGFVVVFAALLFHLSINRHKNP